MKIATVFPLWMIGRVSRMRTGIESIHF